MIGFSRLMVGRSPMRRIFASALIVVPQISSVQVWPTSHKTVRYALDDAVFLAPTQVHVTMECSWDGGQTFPWSTSDTWTGGAKSRSGHSPSVELGPFEVGDGAGGQSINNPTHVRYTIADANGTIPICGLVMKV